MNEIVSTSADTNVQNALQHPSHNDLFIKSQTFKGHSDSVSALVFDDSHGILFTASLDCSIKVWILETGALKKSLPVVHKQGICSLTLWKGFLYSGSFDATIIKWGLTHFDQLHTYHGHTEAVYAIVGVDGFLISASRDSTVRVWNEASPESGCSSILRGHSAAILCLCLIGEHLFTGSDDSLIKKWVWKEQRCVGDLRGHGDSVTCVRAWTDEMLLSASYDATVRFWDVTKATCVRVCQAESGLRSVDLNAGARLLFAAANDASLYAWELYGRSARPAGVQRMARSGLTCLQVAGGAVLVGSADKCCRAWRLATGESGGWQGRGAGGEGGEGAGAGRGDEATRVPPGAYARLTGLRWARDDALAEARPGPADDGPEGDAEGAAGDEDGAGGEVLEVLRCHADKVHAVVWVPARPDTPPPSAAASPGRAGSGPGAPPSGLLVSASSDGTVVVTSLPQLAAAVAGQGERRLTGHRDRVLCLAAAGDVVYSGGADGVVCKWSLSPPGGRGAEVPLAVLQGHTDWVACLAAGDGWAMSGSWDGSVRQWDMASDRCLRTLRGHTDAVYALALAPGVMFSGSRDCTVRAWDTATGECVRVYGNGHTAAVSAVVARDPLLYTASWDKTVRVWDMATGRVRNVVATLPRPVLALALDGPALLVSVSDGTVRAVDMDSLAEIHAYRRHKQAVNGLAMVGPSGAEGGGPEGCEMWTCGDDGLLVRWRRRAAELEVAARPVVTANAWSLASPLPARIRGAAAPEDGSPGADAAKTPSAPNLAGRLLQTLQRVQVATPPPVHGWLFKKGGVFGRWSKRFFRLEAGLLLYYTCDPGTSAGGKGGGKEGAEALPLDHVLMSDLLAVVSDESDPGPSGRHLFRVETVHRRYVLAAKTAEARRRWTTVLAGYVERNDVLHKMELKRLARSY